jgi:hypothetical protein
MAAAFNRSDDDVDAGRNAWGVPHGVVDGVVKPMIDS